MPARQGQPKRARSDARLRRAPPSTPQTETFLARSIRGLEWLGAAEIEADLKAFVLEVGHREIVFRAPFDPAVLELGSVDDLFLLCGKIDEIDRGRISLPRLAKGLRKLPLVRSLARIESLRPIRRSSGFEVIGSFLGRRNFNRSEIEFCAGTAISEITGMPFHDHEAVVSPERDVSWRIHMRDNQAVVGLRVALRPLHRRDYRVSSAPGALHPPVAYAMNMLSGAYPGCQILDPCCGTGTLLIEAGWCRMLSLLAPILIGIPCLPLPAMGRMQIVNGSRLILDVCPIETALLIVSLLICLGDGGSRPRGPSTGTRAWPWMKQCAFSRPAAMPFYWRRLGRGL